MNPAAGEGPIVRISRTIPASPELVYRAWLDPELIRRWMAPGAFEATQVEVDERIGGRYRIVHTNAGTVVGGFECEIVELVPDRCIVWRWSFAGPEGRSGPTYDSVLRVALQATSDGGTELELVHERLGELAAALPQVADKVAAGWEDVLTKLGAALSAAGSRL